jgi:hypothetical protein
MEQGMQSESPLATHLVIKKNLGVSGSAHKSHALVCTGMLPRVS